MLPHTTSAVSTFPEDDVGRPIQFASKTGVGTTGLFRCSNVEERIAAGVMYVVRCIFKDTSVESTRGISDMSSQREFPRWAPAQFGVR